MDATAQLDLAAFVAEGLRKRRIRDFKIAVYEKDESSLAWREDRLDELSSARLARLSVELYRDLHWCHQSTTDLRRETLAVFLDSAISLLDILPEDPFRLPPDPSCQGLPETTELNLYDRTVDGRDIEERKRTVREIYELTRKTDGRIVEANAASYECHDLFTDLYSSGFSVHEDKTYLATGVSLTVLADTERVNGGYAKPSRTVAGLEDAGIIARTAVERSLCQLGQKKEASGRYDLIWFREIAPRLFHPLLSSLQGWALDQKRTIYDRELGKAIASPILTLRDDPAIPGGFGSKLCDGNGYPAKKRDIIRDGVLSNYLIDLYHSRKLDLEVTMPWISNCVLEPGSGDLDDLIPDVERGILVTETNGGNDNPATGDFSIGISGILIEKGKQSRPVNEMIVSGNYRDLLQRLDAVAADVYTGDCFRFPSIRFRDLEVAGL